MVAIREQILDSLAPLLESRAAVAHPFHWSGANSELARRNAGQALFECLFEPSFHLVGHSHGGSVIWHALTRSAARNRRFT